MFRLIPKKQKKNVIAERIKALEDKLWVIQMTGKEDNIDTIVRYSKDTVAGTSQTYRIIKLDTAYGERILAVNSSSLYYGGSNLIEYNNNNEYDWSFNFIFSIEIKDDDKVAVEFSPDFKMSKETVDLAILEFEEYIDKIYKKITKRESNYEDLVNYLKEGC